MSLISWKDFEKVDIRVGTILSAEEFPEAHKPAYILTVDLGEELGTKKSSAQITSLYSTADLVGKQVLCVVNFPSKQIGPIRSEVLVTGFDDGTGKIVLAGPDTKFKIQNGSKLF